MPDFDDLRSNARHGTRARYKAGCSCDPCREANTAYHRDLRRRKDAQRGYADAAPPRQAYRTASRPPPNPREVDDPDPADEDGVTGASPLPALLVLGGLAALVWGALRDRPPGRYGHAPRPRGYRTVTREPNRPPRPRPPLRPRRTL